MTARLFIAIAALATFRCAAVPGKGPPSMGCLDISDPACPDPTAYAPLTAMLPVGPPGMLPPPRWFVPPDYQPPPPKTPDQEAAERLLQKLGK